MQKSLESCPNEIFNPSPDNAMDPDLPHRALAACLEVHRHLGPGLNQEAYEECLAIELRQLEMPCERGKALRFVYRGQTVDNAARLDFVVEEELLVQVLAVDEVLPSDLARTESLLRLANLRTGLLVNFNVPVLRKGVHRVNLKRRSGPAADGDE